MGPSLCLCWHLRPVEWVLDEMVEREGALFPGLPLKDESARVHQLSGREPTFFWSLSAAAILDAYLVAFMTENLIQAIRDVGDPLAMALGLEILDVQCTGKPAKPLVRLTLDKEGGVGIADCEQFHQSLRRTWEITQPEGPSCRFEVSSPGLDRPLKDRKDFQRVQGQRLRVTLQDDESKPVVVIERLRCVTEAGLQLVDDRSKVMSERFVAWNEIIKAKVEVEF